MRLKNQALQDVKFQFKHGFYFIYAVLILLYVSGISLLPQAWKQDATAIVLFSDPAAIGFFFIGGIMLLEKGERLLDALFVSPLTPTEYILSKAISLGFVSVFSGILITALSGAGKINYVLLAAALFAGSIFFTLSGIIIAVSAKSVNHYMVISLPLEVILNAPPLLLLIGENSTILEIFPGSLALRLIQWSSGMHVPLNPALMFVLIILWGIPIFFFALKRMESFLSKIGGGSNEVGL